MSKNETFISPARKEKKNNLKKIKYKPLDGRKFENKFDEDSVDKQIPKIEKDIDKKVGRVGEFTKVSRPNQQKVEYICSFCGRGEIRLESAIYDAMVQAESYQCRDCSPGKRGGKRRLSQ